MWPNPQFPAELVTFTEEIVNGKLHFCEVLWTQINIPQHHSVIISQMMRISCLKKDTLLTKKTLDEWIVDAVLCGLVGHKSPITTHSLSMPRKKHIIIYNDFRLLLDLSLHLATWFSFKDSFQKVSFLRIVCSYNFSNGNAT